MSTATVVNKIAATELAYLPTVIAAVQVAETVDTTGENKYNATLDYVSGISGAVAQVSSNPTVASISAMINMTAAIFHLLDKFKHKTDPVAS